MGGLLHLVQRRGAWAGCGPAQSPSRCTKCNNLPINGQCTNFMLERDRVGFFSGIRVGLVVDFSWPALRARYASVANVNPAVVRPVIISRKMSKIDPLNSTEVGTADSIAALRSSSS